MNLNKQAFGPIIIKNQDPPNMVLFSKCNSASNSQAGDNNYAEF